MRKKSMWKRALALSSSLAMLTTLNVTAFADGGVAEVGGIEYATLAAAAAAANDGDIVTLVADIADAGNVTVNKNITIDGNDKKITGDSRLTIAKTAEVTITGVNFEDIHNDKNTLSAIYAGGLEGKLTVTDCTFDDVDWDAIQVTPASGAEITITGNTFKDTDSTVVAQRYVHIESAKEATDYTVTVTGNKMYGTLAQESMGVYYVKDDTTAKLSGNYIEGTVCILGYEDGWVNKGELAFPMVEEDLTTEASQAAIIGSAYTQTFATLAEAIAAANDGDTVTLLADASGDGSVIDKDITIDFGGHTYTVTGMVGSAGTVTNGYQLLKDNNITFKNGTLKQGVADMHIFIQNYSNLTLEDVTIDGTFDGEGDDCDYVVSNNNGANVLKGNTNITAADGKVAFDAWYWPSAGYGSVSITTVDFTGTVEGNIQLAGQDGVDENLTVNLTSGTFVNEGEVIRVSGGKLNIGADATVTSDTDNCVFIRGGSVTTAGTLVTNDDAYAAIKGNANLAGDLTVTGGSITANSIAIYWPQDGDLVIEDGTITGSTGVYVKGGTVTVTGGEIVGNGEARDFVHNVNGADSTGDAIVVEASSYVDATGAQPVANITGGTFTSANAKAIAVYTESDEYALDNEKFISGGTFNTEIPVENCAEGLVPVANGDGTYGVAEAPEVVDVASFLGGSLRIDSESYEKASLRFGYVIDDKLPEGAEIVSWSWAYGFSADDLTYTADGTEYVDTDMGKVSNLVLTDIPTAYFQTSYYAQITVVYELYGIEYTAVDDVQSRNVYDVAVAILLDESESAAARGYAANLIAAYGGL